ncbi:DUF4440 domain-containing protein [Cognatishimia sp. SS12]|uniref:DUF4440 domain-containing protein n=1 Tax=Cognatishimia sp. SS12 TaxID=2979465 RepID=UPI00232E063A|nr:DUF4440 domain-containing protein [Cognatishimia sp. SS12]MDC0738546.1 DUF4440 domain-containing protein [Cognatishimia sp. SS12]
MTALAAITEKEIRAFMGTYHDALSAFDPAVVADFWRFPCELATPQGKRHMFTAQELTTEMAAVTRLFASSRIAHIDRFVEFVHLTGADEALVITRVEATLNNGTEGPRWTMSYIMRRQNERWKIARLSTKGFALTWGDDACVAAQAATPSSLN